MRKYRMETYIVFRIQWQIHIKKDCSESSCLCLPLQCLTVRNKMQNCSWWLFFFSPIGLNIKFPRKLLCTTLLGARWISLATRVCCINVRMLLFPSFLFFCFKMWAALCSHGNNIHDDEMSFLHVIDPTRSIAIFNKNRVSIPLNFLFKL